MWQVMISGGAIRTCQGEGTGVSASMCSRTAWTVIGSRSGPCGVPVGGRIGRVKRNDDGLKPSFEIERSAPAGAVTPQARRHYGLVDQVDQLCAASEADADLAFMTRLMTLCSMPRTDPGEQRVYVRRNGPYKLAMFSSGETKLPYGNLPRLLMAYVCTEAIQTQSPVLILGESVAEFMRKLDIYSSSGQKYARLREQMVRLFNVHVQLLYEDENGQASVNALIARSTELWWNPKRPYDRTLWDNKIELSQDFFNEIIRHPVPMDMNILKALKRSSLGLDLYLWLTYRTFSLVAPKRLSWPVLYRQFWVEPDRADDNVTVQNFRKDCLRELKKIKAAWPGLKYQIERGRPGEKDGALILLPSMPAIPALKLVT